MINKNLTQITVLQTFTYEGYTGRKSKLKLTAGDKFMVTPDVCKVFKNFEKSGLVVTAAIPVNDKLNVYDGKMVWKRNNWDSAHGKPGVDKDLLEKTKEIKVDANENLKEQFRKKPKKDLVEYLFSINQEFTVNRLNRMRQETLIDKIVNVLTKNK